MNVYERFLLVWHRKTKLVMHSPLMFNRLRNSPAYIRLCYGR